MADVRLDDVHVVQSYEALAHDCLGPALRHTMDAVDRVRRQHGAYLRLSEALQRLDDAGDGPSNMLVDIGLKVYANGSAASTDVIVVELGAGIFAELTRVEAKAFAVARRGQLVRRERGLLKAAAELRGRIEHALRCAVRRSRGIFLPPEVS